LIFLLKISRRHINRPDSAIRVTTGELKTQRSAKRSLLSHKPNSTLPI